MASQRPQRNIPGQQRGNRQQNRRPPRPNPSATLPLDLCAWGDVTAGFATLEPVLAIHDRLLLPGDLPGTAKSLAGESIGHLVEGWRNLSAATSAVLNNAHHQVIHFAYYAELRAAFALLACSGVRMSYPDHKYLGNAGQPVKPTWYNRPTHKAVWELWQAWAKSSSAEALFSDKLKILPSVSLRTISQELNRANASNSLLLWGFDLVDVANDHVARNTASYEPLLPKSPLPVMQSADLDFLRNLWQLLQPANVGLQFELSFVHYIIDLEIGEKAAMGGFDSEKWYSTLIRQIAGATGAREEELEGLLKTRTYSTALFAHGATCNGEWKSVLSRSVFLLRLASKAIEESLAASASSPGKQWCRNWLQHAGVFDPTAGAMPADIWADYDDLPNFVQPNGVIPNVFQNSLSASNLAARLSRPDACLAWALGV